MTVPALLLTSFLLLFRSPASTQQQQQRETPEQIRRILAQSSCLAVAYPGSELAKDAEAIYALYAPLLKLRDPLAARRKVEALATAENPAKPSPVGNQNLALATCALFAERGDVLAAMK